MDSKNEFEKQCIQIFVFFTIIFHLFALEIVECDFYIIYNYFYDIIEFCRLGSYYLNSHHITRLQKMNQKDEHRVQTDLIFPDYMWNDITMNECLDVHPIGPNNNSTKIKNRLAAKRCREKKDQMLLQLEMSNDILRQEALRLSRQAMTLQIENRYLEDDLKFFQKFMAVLIKK
ncbi:hypothetical protein TRFO_21180 [Tritrichomonas foetus]|uniref:BZIP domain-containing protein n=1 Tax=Tritrichomonas foetus TaxID=1144522 RepID=A0A1J4KEA1_9EUKA|nr:hypothetical protein TRFO_21180 [Tritrichomonas foetus]|eukprot:OHT09759.1 hypothetical protein TRFO_21180 [Tritrichomonas foetus]